MLKYKKGDKVWINRGYRIVLAEILEVIEGKLIYYRCSFEHGKIGFLARIFNFYVTDIETLDKFNQRVI